LGGAVPFFFLSPGRPARRLSSPVVLRSSVTLSLSSSVCVCFEISSSAFSFSPIPSRTYGGRPLRPAFRHKSLSSCVPFSLRLPPLVGACSSPSVRRMVKLPFVAVPSNPHSNTLQFLPSSSLGMVACLRPSLPVFT